MTRSKIPFRDLTEEQAPAKVRTIEGSLHVEDYPIETDPLVPHLIGNVDIIPFSLANGVLVRYFAETLRSSVRVIQYQPHTRESIQDVHLEIADLKGRVTRLEAKETIERRGQVSIEVARTLAKLATVYNVSDDLALIEHIDKHHTDADVLVEAALELRRRFGDGVKLQLRCDAGFTSLAIRTDLVSDEAEQLRSKFLGEWWLVNEKVDDAIVVALDWAQCGTGAAT